MLMRIHIIAEPTPNFACNSLLTIFNFEFMSLELQRFWALLKVQAIELHAKFGEGGRCWGEVGCWCVTYFALLVA